ncbi:DUF1534 domain-containing protein [Pseudomonas coronafaciens pv. oryzae str. 1_6]|nr:DUF1534 domain-containing protein [Pseudomonas coronafaciens pv. oryzae str. 1_6]
MLLAIKSGRRASGNASPRGAWPRWCSPGRLSFITQQPRHLSSRTRQPRPLSFLTLQRGNAVRDALRHTSRSASPSRNASASTRLSCR